MLLNNGQEFLTALTDQGHSRLQASCDLAAAYVSCMRLRHRTNLQPPL